MDMDKLLAAAERHSGRASRSMHSARVDANLLADFACSILSGGSVVISRELLDETIQRLTEASQLYAHRHRTQDATLMKLTITRLLAAVRKGGNDNA